MEAHTCQHNDISYPKGLKWTQQRKCVYQVLEEATEPLSAVQIYNRIEKEHEGSDYAVSTIYRILATFEEHGMVEKTTFMGTIRCFSGKASKAFCKAISALSPEK